MSTPPSTALPRVLRRHRYRFVASALTLAMLVASVGVGATSSVSAQADVCPPVDHPVDADDPSIIVDAPEPGAAVESPVQIAGEARVFEANVLIAIYDANGTEVASTFTTAHEAAPAMAPFATQVVFNVTQTQDGCIWIFEESADDGSARNVVAVPVTLTASEEAPPPAPTGDAGIGSNAPILVLTLTVIAAAWLVLAGRVATGAPERTR